MHEVNQEELRELEKLCTQEQPPSSTAACPLHVDCRGICQALAEGSFDKARTIYEKTVPYPELLTKICEAPCQGYCVCSQEGYGIFLRKLEEAAYLYGSSKGSRSFLRKKTKTAGIIGGGICGLTAALELGKKGYGITLYESLEHLGGNLKEHPEFTDQLLEQMIQRLKGYEITLVTGCGKTDPEEIKQKHDAVLIAWGDQEIKGADEYYRCEESGMFAAGDALGSGERTWVQAMADGKYAAISMDRYLQGVSVEAGRDQEQPFETTLCVDRPVGTEHEERERLEGDKLRRLESPDRLTASEAMEEAQRCWNCQCTRCTDACAFMRYYKSYPRKYLRTVYNNLSIAMGTRHANGMINACSLCGQCSKVCPFGLDLGQVIQKAREIMVSKEKMPQSAFDFALEDMEFSNHECYLASKERCQYVYFPGCQLSASTPEIVKDSYQDLCQRMDGTVGLILGCCGIMAKWAGESKRYEETLDKLRDSMERMGNPVVITACPTCYDTFTREFPDRKVLGIWEVLERIGLPKKVEKTKDRVLHDACGARLHPEIRESIRGLAKAAGIRVEEQKYSGEQTGCCGYGGLTQFSNPEVGAEITCQALEGEGSFLTYCINCRDRFAKAGADSLHILEVIYGSHPDGSRPWPSYSLRRKNRFRLQEDIRREIWKEEVESMDETKLYYPLELEEQLEKRLILESDICQVIAQAEREQNRIWDKDSGVFIAHKKVGHVTYWVYYREREDGYEILKTYAHRMRIKGE